MQISSPSPHILDQNLWAAALQSRKNDFPLLYVETKKEPSRKDGEEDSAWKGYPCHSFRITGFLLPGPGIKGKRVGLW